MGNKLFQLAKDSVYNAESSSQKAVTPVEYQNAIKKIKIAKNNISSAFANSTTAEKIQLQQLQQQLENAEHSLDNDHYQM